MQEKIKKSKILLTGGHAATTAYCVIDEIQKEHKDIEIHFIGAKTSIEGKKIKTLEQIIFPRKNVLMHSLYSGKLSRRLSIAAFFSFLRIPFGFIHALYLLIKIKPDVVLSFGGYVGLPVVFASWILQIPCILHEQTVAVGLANKLSSFFADKITIAREDSKLYFKEDKVVLVGNPILPKILELSKKVKKHIKPVAYITGGSRGAHKINIAIKPIIDKLIKLNYKIIHQTGVFDFNEFDNYSKNLQNYEVYETIDPDDLGEIYEKIDIVIGRSGANTVCEIGYLGIPSILIPIPWTRYDEQTKNAKSLEKSGLAQVLKEDDLTPENLLNKIIFVNENWNSIVKNYKNEFEFDKNASQKIVDLIFEYIAK